MCSFFTRISPGEHLPVSVLGLGDDCFYALLAA